MPAEVPEVPPRVLDALLGVAVTLSLALVIAAGHGGNDPPEPGAYGFALGFGGLMLLRRQLPRTVLVLTAVGLLAYYAFDHPPLGVAVPMSAALFSAAQAGRTGWAVAVGTGLFAVSLPFRLREGEPAGLLLGYELVTNGALVVAATALGYAVRSRRTTLSQQEELASLAVQRTAQGAELRRQQERTALSRDLHDTVGHTLAMISVQAAVAQEALVNGPQEAVLAVARIREAGNASVHELGSMVRLLRDGTSDAALSGRGRGALSVAAVGSVVEAARHAGLDVTTDLPAPGTELPSGVDAVAYRIVQESLTNVVRHSSARSAHVLVTRRGEELHVRISDDGRGAGRRTDDDSRHGLRGMEERVRLMGGTLATSSPPGGGFVVDAVLPIRVPSYAAGPTP